MDSNSISRCKIVKNKLKMMGRWGEGEEGEREGGSEKLKVKNVK
jgi:hypothetical protein